MSENSNEIIKEDPLGPIAANAREAIKQCKKVLLVASRPIDYDCLGSTLAMGWYLDKLGIDYDMVTFNKKNTTAHTFPGTKRIKFTYINQVNFPDYDAWVLLDGGDWHQFFTKSWKNVLSQLDLKNVIHIDHHSPGSITDAVDLTVQKLESCTAKVVHDYFIEPEGLEMDKQVGLWIYMALISDTGNFKHLMYEDTFSFASKLYNLDLDHNRAVEVQIPKKAMDFTVWAIENTQYLEKIQTTALVIDDKKRQFIKSNFPEKAEENLDAYYKQIFMRLSIGYPYALIFEVADNGTKVSWRTRTGSKIEIKSVLTQAGFQAGGHRNAGGGISESKEIENLVAEFTRLMALYY